MADPVETPVAAPEAALTPPVAEPTETPAEKPNGKAKANGAATEEQAPPDEGAMLRELAAKLGFEVEDRKLTTKERAAFREKARQMRAEIDAEIQQRREAFEAEVSPRRAQVERAMLLEQAYEVGDYEGMARALGRKDWNDLQNDVIAKLADPNYKELQELKRWREETAQREQRQREEWIQNQKNEQIRQAVASHKADLSDRMAESADPLVREMHDDPMFIEAVYRIQAENWDGEHTVSPEKAIRMAAKGTAKALRDELEGLHKRLSKAFQPAETPAAEEPAKPNLKAPAPKTGPASKPSAAAMGKWDFSDPKQEAAFRERAKNVLAEAAARETLEQVGKAANKA
jgi:hypothetical protein